MYSLNMSEFRKKKTVEKKPLISMPKVTPVTAAAIAVPVIILFALMIYFDYSSISRADSIIDRMVATKRSRGRGHREKMRALAGTEPDSDLRGKVLRETYTFDRVLPLLSPRTATVIYGGRSGVAVLANHSPGFDGDHKSFE